MKKKFDYEQAFMGVGYEHAGGSGKSYTMDYRLERVRSRIVVRKGNILDLGCGGGTNTEKLVGMYKGARVYGCDISKTAIAYAMKYGGGKVTYNAMNGKKFPYTSNMFDVIVCLDVLEHVPNVQGFLKEVYRVLKKGGRLYFVVPCEGQPFTYTWVFQHIGLGSNLTRENWGHIHPEFTHKKVVSLMEAVPLTVTHVSYSEHWLYQLSNILFYFLPKVALKVFLGAKSSTYTDQGMIASETKKKQPRNIMTAIRSLWLWMSDAFGLLRNVDLWYGKYLPFGSWKVHVVAVKK